MGQKQSREGRASVQESRPKPSYSGILRASFCSDRNDESFCFGPRNQRQSFMSKHKISWKKFILEQLNDVLLETWPEILVDYLKNNNTDAEDSNFQKELYQTDFNFVNQTLHYASSKSMIGMSNNGIQESQDNIPSGGINFDDSSYVKNENPVTSHEQDIKENLKSMIENCEILDENFLHIYKKCWFEKAYDIPDQEEQDNLSREQVQFYKAASPKLINKSADQFRSLNFRRLTLTKSRKHSKQNRSLVPVSPYSQTENNSFLSSYLTEKQGKKSMVKNSNNPKNSQIENAKNKISSAEKYYKILTPYKTITNVIADHLQQSTSIFYQLIEVFQEYFENYYSKVSQDLKGGKILLSQTKDYVLRATKDLQQFSRIICETLIIYYKLDDLKVYKKSEENSLFTRGNILNFVTTFVFNDKTHDILFDLYRKLSLSVEELYEKNSTRCQNLSPEDFGVADEFCLNEKTLQYFRNTGQMKHGGNSVETFYFEESNKKDGESKNSVDDKNDDDLKQLSTHQLDEMPYHNAVQMLITIEKSKNPVQKLQTIAKVAELISIGIEEFYGKFEVANIKKIDADQALSIFMYILVKSQITDVTTHCRIIENFTTTNILESIFGYYATTLEAAVNCVSAMNSDDICYEESGSMNSKDYDNAYSM